MRDVVKTSVRRQQNSKRKRRRTRRHTTYFALVAVLVVGIGIALSMTLFFNITDIVVINETDVPDDQIIALSGISYQDNLVRLDSAIAAEKVRMHVAYAEKVTVSRIFPSTVEIKVEKAEPVANISQSYGYLLVSASNRVLEELKGAPREGLIIITGYNPAQGTIGMVLKSEDEKRDNVLKTLTAAVSECKNEQIKSIDMTDQSDILVQFGDNVTFHMGTSADAVYKLRFAAKTTEHLTPGRKYHLTMIGNNQISEIPEDTIRKKQTGRQDSAVPRGTVTTTAVSTTAAAENPAITVTTAAQTTAKLPE
ncbi:MAG: FtsQ-type POTRA domain-containing protein [Oscillospiraceae bacterium]|nr:FtsQ-type POTRA domain-containing protein [Oscillospiraceae bacterium]MBR5723262.1 FtsQ-type POTRA domain-containing protein [Oscillospiraceae bacterium]